MRRRRVSLRQERHVGRRPAVRHVDQGRRLVVHLRRFSGNSCGRATRCSCDRWPAINRDGRSRPS